MCVYDYPMRCARQPATVPNLRLEIEESCFENQLNSVQNWKENRRKLRLQATFEVMGDPLGAKIAQDAI